MPKYSAILYTITVSANTFRSHSQRSNVRVEENDLRHLDGEVGVKDVFQAFPLLLLRRLLVLLDLPFLEVGWNESGYYVRHELSLHCLQLTPLQILSMIAHGTHRPK